MKRFLKWLFSWRTARRFLIGIAVLVTLYAVFCAEEDWRGKHEWNQYRQQLEAQGVQLNLAAFNPKPVPDDQNFAATPIVQSWFVRWTGTGPRKFWSQEDNYGRVYDQVSPDRAYQTNGNRRFMDLVAWETAFDALRSGKTNSNRTFFKSDRLDLASRAKAAPAVLEGLKTNEAIFAELHAATSRPYVRYPIAYNLDDPWSILLPHLGNLRNVCRRLQLKACAELALGNRQDALEDIKLMLYLGDSVKDEPFLVSQLVRIACLQLVIQPVWEGLAEHAWSEAQLQELQARFQQYNFVADMNTALDGERAAGVLTPELFRKEGLGLLFDLTGSGSATPYDKGVANLFGHIIPLGWYSMEQLSYCRLFQVEIEGGFDPANRRVSPSRLESNADALEHAIHGNGTAGDVFAAMFIKHRVLSAILMPALNKTAYRAATAQAAADQAALACTLERYRLANSTFPETLDALVPRFMSALPHDVITGEPYKYRRTNDGEFVLYSVGWNEKDDGGVPGKTLFDEKEGDWVWQYPPVQ